MYKDCWYNVVYRWWTTSFPPKRLRNISVKPDQHLVFHDTPDLLTRSVCDTSHSTGEEGVTVFNYSSDVSSSTLRGRRGLPSDLRSGRLNRDGSTLCVSLEEIVKRCTWSVTLTSRDPFSNHSKVVDSSRPEIITNNPLKVYHTPLLHITEGVENPL